MDRKTTFITALSLLAIVVYSLSAPAADTETLTLNIAVTNPSPDGAQEVEIKTDLPEELRKGDIVSTDGLDLKFDSEKGTCFVEGKVNLQPSETTFYNIKVRDVWVLPAKEITTVKEEASKYPDIYTAEVAKKLDGILARCNEPVGTADAHIALYRKDKKELDGIKEELRAARSGSKAANNTGQIVLLIVLGLVVALAVFVALTYKNYPEFLKGRLRRLIPLERRRFVRIPNAVETKCRLLNQNESTPVRSTKDISNGGIAVILEKPFRPHSLVELQVKLPDTEKMLTFNGFVVWNKKTVGPDKKESYLTGISFVEVTQEDNQALKDYIEAHLKR